METSFAHIVNLIAPEDNPDLFKAQQITVRSILAARKYVEKMNVDLLSAQFSNACSSVPEGFRATGILKTCSAEQVQLQTKKRFPLLREILSRLNESPDATHFVYTNLDIALMPYFYQSVSGYLDEGYDAIIINRRRISGKHVGSGDLEEMYAEAGSTHTGYDCFVFSRDLLTKFILKDVYIGTPPSGNDLFHNLIVFANNPVLLTEKHLTFHVGMELVKPWGDPVLNQHNEREYRKILRELKPLMNIAKFPGAGYGIFKRHFKWLMNPTFHYPTMCALDLSQLGMKRRQPCKNELSGLKNRYYEWLLRKINFRDKD